jgi:hypothetical protein
MKPAKKSILISFFVFCITSTGFAQEKNYSTNVKTEFNEERMLVSYDAVAIDGTQSLEIVLMVTYNGQKVKTNFLYGDYGSNVAPGTGKNILWYYKDDFKGDINNVKVDVFAFKQKETEVELPSSFEQSSATIKNNQPIIEFFSIRGGGNLSRMMLKNDNENISEDYKMTPGFQFGLTAELKISEMAAFETGIIFSTKGVKMKEEYLDEEFKATINLNYLEIPLNAKLYFSEGDTRIFGLIGPYIGYGLSGKTKIEDNYAGETETRTNDLKFGSSENDDLKSLDFGLAAGVGLDASRFQVGLTYSYGLANISSYTESGMTIKNRNIALYVGIKFGTK